MSDPVEKSVDDTALFWDKKTSIRDIEAAGWYVYGSSSGDWWWTHRETHSHFFPPRWMKEWNRDTEESARRFAINDVREALGMPPLKGKKKESV